ALLLIALTLTGCKKSSQQSSNEGKPAERPAQQQEVQSVPNELKIEREMLRDLRITSARVEQRAGADGVNLLGELTVNENAYAQVGSPISGRVVQISASVGEDVKRGQQLAVIQSTELGKARSERISAQSRLDLAHKV